MSMSFIYTWSGASGPVLAIPALAYGGLSRPQLIGENTAHV